MGALSFFGHFFLGLGPEIAFFCTIIAPKSFLTLLSFFSCFLWLVVLLLTSAIFKGFEPWPVTTSSYAGVLVASVAIQEGVRYTIWMLHTKGVTILDGIAHESGHRFALVDKLYMAMAWGFGHAACHSIFFFLSFLPLTVGDGTFYISTCDEMSVFLIGALYSVAFGMILTSSNVVAFEGYRCVGAWPAASAGAADGRSFDTPAWKHWAHVFYAPALHMLASLLTLLNMAHGGCVAAQTVNLCLGVLSTGYASYLAWTRGSADHKRHLAAIAGARLSQDSHAGLLGLSGQPDIDASAASGGPLLQPSGSVVRRPAAPATTRA